MKETNTMNHKIARLVTSGLMIAMTVIAVQTSFSQTKAYLIPLDRLEKSKLQHVKAEFLIHSGRRALRVADAAKPTDDVERLLILPESDFQDGTIELEMTGDVLPNAPESSRGFVGIAFRVARDATKYECFYLRPLNSRVDDQVRRNHSAQYVAHPDWPWPRLRKEFPEKYESYVDLVAGAWTKVKIEVRGTEAKLYVHGATQPTLVVTDLKLGKSRGPLALWVGPGTVAHFANLRLTPWKETKR